MAFRSDISAVILGALQPGPSHGYQIVRRIRESGCAQRLSEGQIYPYLHRLEREGLVCAEWQTDTGAAPRKVYELTPAGLAELNRQRKIWENFSAGVGNLLAARTTDLEAGNA